MNTKELKELAEAIDITNAAYIIADQIVRARYNSYKRYMDEGKSEVATLVLEDLEKEIATFNDRHLTPVNARVGDGATVNYYTDRHAGTIVKVTKSTITIRRDKAIKSPDFKPKFILGGFSAHCTNQDEQSYTYEPDENGDLTTLHWSRKYNQYGQPGDLTASKGRHEFYDYNF